MLSPSELREENLEKAVASALNCHSAENASNTPDWILSQFVLGCLSAYNTAVQQRETWYGRDARPGSIRSVEPSPRILKASEITEPGWYAYRKPHGKWNVNMLSGLSYFTADKSTLANGWDDYELYGPIQLPE